MSSAHDEARDNKTDGYTQFYERLDVWRQVMDGAPGSSRPMP